MTPASSIVRLLLYVFIAMLTAAGSGILAVEFTDPKQCAAFVIAVLASGLNAARSYIDKSPSQVVRDPEP